LKKTLDIIRTLYTFFIKVELLKNQKLFMIYFVMAHFNMKYKISRKLFIFDNCTLIILYIE